MLPPRGFSRSPKFSAKAICWSSVMSWPWNTSTAYLSMPASISAASSLVSGLRRSTPETSPTKCLVSCRIAIAIAFPPEGGLSRLICGKSYSRGGRCQRLALRIPLCIFRVPDAGQRLTLLRRAGTHWQMDPGSAAHRFALRRVRRTPSRIARHQAAVDGNDGAGQERGSGQAQAQGHVRDLFGIAVPAERGASLGVDGFV